MSMAVYGSLRFEANEVNMTRLERSSILSPRGRKLMTVQRVMLEIVVQRDTVAALTTRINTIQTAFQSNYQDFNLYSDDAGTTLSAHYLHNNVADCISGVRVIRGPVFDRADGTEYANKRTALVVLEGVYDTSDDDLVQWEENLEFIGTGAPDFAVLNGFDGPFGFLISPATPQIIVQTGRAIGFVAPVLPPGPIFSNVIIRGSDQREGYGSGKVQGLQARFYPSHWQYVMTSLTPQFGLPITR